MVYMGDGFDTMRENFLNENVAIMVSETNSRYEVQGTVVDINPQGVTIAIVNDDGLFGECGQKRFISFSSHMRIAII